MILRIDTDRHSVLFDEAQDCKRLSAVVSGTGDLRGALGALGEADADGAHLWILVDELRKGAIPPGDTAWMERFDGMIRYAHSKGWLDATGTRVRVHIARA
jgi:hypothetical protein